MLDAGAKYHKTCSNDHLLKGPDLLNNLVSILMRFRLGEFAVLEQILYQVKVKGTDREALRFLWRESPDKAIIDYEMTPYLFGKTDSPSCSNFALKRRVLDKADILEIF